MRIIDAHAHIFPEKIADKASEAIGDFYDLPMNSGGGSKTLLEQEKECGVEKMLVCSSALSAKNVESINTFIASEVAAHPEFVGLASLHKDYENYKEEISRIKELGLKGIKFHSDMQKTDIDDKALYPVYEEIQKQNLPVLLHMGDDRYDYSSPARMVKVAKDFPGITFIGAHFGGYLRWHESIDNPLLDNVYYDTCSSLAFMKKGQAEEFINRFGADRFFFGTDFPMWDTKGEIERFMALDLDEEAKQMILYGNFARVFGICD